MFGIDFPRIRHRLPGDCASTLRPRLFLSPIAYLIYQEPVTALRLRLFSNRNA